MEYDIIVGDDDIASGIAFGRRSQESIDRDYKRLDRFVSRLRDKGASRIKRIKDSINVVNDAYFQDVMRKVNQRTKAAYREDRICYFNTSEEIADAGPKVRRWLLGNKRLGTVFKQGRIDGWGASEEFLDLDEGEEDPYHRAVYNGVTRKDPETGKHTSAYVYGARNVRGERLTLDEQLDLLATYYAIDDLLDEGLDPTSPTGESI